MIFQTLNCVIKFNGVTHVLEIQYLLQYHAELDPNSSLLPTITEVPFFSFNFTWPVRQTYP